jgi:hypothetical protein
MGIVSHLTVETEVLGGLGRVESAFCRHLVKSVLVLETVELMNGIALPRFN